MSIVCEDVEPEKREERTRISYYLIYASLFGPSFRLPATKKKDYNVHDLYFDSETYYKLTIYV